MYDVDLQNNLMIIREFENPEKLYLETLLVSKQKYGTFKSSFQHKLYEHFGL